MRKYFLKFFIAALLATSVLGQPACLKKDPAITNNTKPPVVVTGDLIKLPAEWVKATALMNGFPDGIEVYHRIVPFSGKNMNAYCVVFDPKNPALEFKPVLFSADKKPGDIYSTEAGTKYACINGGFFGTNTSYSLVMYNNAVQAVNIRALSRTYNNVSTTYYPTRGAFGITANGVPQVTWVYSLSNTLSGSVISYPVPSANELNQAPQSQPSATFPSGGNLWNVTSAIGGSPVLIKNDIINLTDKEELIAIDNTTSRARSAIGYNADGKIFILAVEGNNSAGGTGLNLLETASLLKSMGCTAALNLDGGGSTCLIVNGQQTVKPSDAAGERAVISAILIKKK